MLKDIQFESIDGIGLAIIREATEDGTPGWNAYLVNYSTKELEGVLISSQGWGLIDGEERKTSQLRHFLDKVEPLSYRKIELIPEELLQLTNQYWFSCFLDGSVYEHKFIVESGSIAEENCETVSLINKSGILMQS
ncbi:MAG: hypothetical protein L6Q78_08320 [Bacteroidia bacterium]|nr:hypothetical protein [Bacteroidia bacterium]